MKHFKGIGLLVAGILMLVACTQEDELTKRNGREVTLEIPVVAPGLSQVGIPLTRSDKVDNEGKIFSLYIVQFYGDNGTATLAKSEKVTLDASNKVSFTFALPGEGYDKCRVYMVANLNPDPSTGMTLEQFEKKLMTFAATATVPGTGLPMCDFKDFDPAGKGVGPTFTMKAMVAKLRLVCTLSDLTRSKLKDGKLTVSVKNIPNGSFCGTPTTYTGAWRPTAPTFADKANVGEISTGTFTYTIYIPENIAGQNSAVKRLIHRSVVNAPANSTCFMLDGSTTDGETEVHIALFYGSPKDSDTTELETSDFNVKRNYFYTLTATIVDLDDTDQRVSMKGDFMYINENNPAWGEEPNVPSDAFGN